MRKGAIRLLLLLVIQAAATVFALLAIRAGALPLGVVGEWEWLRVGYSAALLDVALAATGIAVYAVAVGFAALWLARRATYLRECLLLAALTIAACALQAVIQSGAPLGYGLAKWVVAIHDEGAGGYLTIAKYQATDLGDFLAKYPEWIKAQDSLHVGTHPPGLIVFESFFLRLMESIPVTARWIDTSVPSSISKSFKVYAEYVHLNTTDRAAVVLTGLFALVVCSATVIPLYVLARANLTQVPAFAVAALWPVVPAAILFQPTADTFFPFLACGAFAIAVHAPSALPRRGFSLGVVAGIILGLGMQFSLVFLAIGLIVALVVLSARGVSIRRKTAIILATGIGFLGFTLLVWFVTSGNPFLIWWYNQKNHARFYAEYSRSYRAWVIANPIELFVALGIPISILGLIGLVWPREIPRISIATLVVLAFLTLSGRNLSEVARLWIPFMPALILAAGYALARLDAGPKTIALGVLITGLQTLALEALIQVVYPV